jgi:hypothetical protein
MGKVKMSVEDITAVLSAAETLDRINVEYGCPHGVNPMGIVIHALLELKGGQHGCDDKAH